MASLLNSTVNNVADDFTGQWEDVKDYTNTIVTLKPQSTGTCTLEWAATEGRTLPSNGDIVTSETFTASADVAITKQYDHRSRWFRLRYDEVPGSIQTLHKKAPTALKIVDASSNIVSINTGTAGNSLYTVLTDASGIAIRTTQSDSETQGALLVHLADSSGISLSRTAGNNLHVALRDVCDNAISTTGLTVSGNAMYVRPGDQEGRAQAATLAVQGAYTSGVALYAALADSSGNMIDTTTTNPTGTSINAMYVQLADENGQAIGPGRPLNVVASIESSGALAFDISTGVTTTFVTFPDLSAGAVNLYNIGVYNDGPNTAWLKIYDICYTLLDDENIDGTDMGSGPLLALPDGGRPKYIVTAPAGRARDLVFPGGAKFTQGVYFRATTGYANGSVESPATNTVFVNGSYLK